MSETNLSLNATARAMRKLAHRQGMDPDGIRHETRRRVWVTPIPEMQVLPGGYLAQRHSEEPLVVYESDVPRIQELVEDKALIDDAKKWCDESKQAHIAAKTRPGKSPPEWHDVAADYTGPLNWSHAFRQRNLRPCKPLLAVKVEDEVLDPPQSTEELRSMAQTEAIVKAVMSAMQENNRSDSSGRRGK